MERFLANMYIYIYNNLFVQSDTYKSITTYSDAIMKALGSKNGALNNVYIGMEIFAYGILAVYFIITVGTMMEGREISMSIIFKTLLRFFVGAMLVSKSFEIVSSMFKIGDWMAGLILDDVSVIGSLDEYYDAFVHTVGNMNFLGQVKYIVKALPPYIMCVAASLTLIYAIVTRVLRICTSAVLSPIAVANFFEGSRRSDSVKFLKKTMSMCLQCSVIMVITAATANIVNFATSNSVYSDSMEQESVIVKARDDMVESLSTQQKRIEFDVDKAMESRHYAYEATADPKIKTAANALKSGIEEVKEADEVKYIEYEDFLDLRIFERTEDNHYEYDEDGNAKISPKYKCFDENKLKAFMDIMLGGSNYMVFIFFMVARIGLIKKSTSLCDTIVGL